MKPMRVSILLACAAVLPSCAPVFSDLQSAKLVGRGRVELTPSASTVSFADDGDTDHVQNHVGVQVATGVADRLDLRARYERVEGVNAVGAGPKLSLVKDKVAIYVPVGFAFGDDVASSESWQVHPTLLLTAPVSDRFELNGSAKYLYSFEEDTDGLVAFNVGAGLSTNLEKWAIRPEVGILVNPGEEGHFTQFSLGVSVRP
jgi:hypothetical protein